MSKDLVCVMRFLGASEAALPQSLLEIEGIRTMLEDDQDWMVPITGGARLLVQGQDYERAMAILIHHGYIKSTIVTPDALADVTGMQTSIKRLLSSSWGRIVFIGTIATSVVLAVFAYQKMTEPSTIEKLKSGSWFAVSVVFNGRTLEPHSTGIHLVPTYTSFTETVVFDPSGTIHLPGFDSEEVVGRWTYDHQRLRVSQCNRFSEIYEGEYNVAFAKNDVMLLSSTTKIICRDVPFTLFK